jgi:predicted DCC family thiol-disulfide oxidoreductase YuxK
MNSTRQMSSWQFTAFRIIFGAYLAIHFAQLLPYAGELFGSHGVLADARLNPLHGLFPNPLTWISWPVFPAIFILLLVLVSLAFTAGFYRRTSTLVLWFGWACLFNRNNLIANPGIPYVGLLLILCALVPPGEPLSIRKRTSPHAWCMPSAIYWGAWLLLAIGYAFSGMWKLFSPSWIDGTALMHLLNNPLARPGWMRDVLLQWPLLLKVLTWTALAGEILFLPLCLTRRGRLIAWLWMALMHVGILLVVDFADLTFGMLMIHLFTFDPKWIPARGAKAVVLFDGDCAMCNRWVRFITREEQEPGFQFAPLQSDAGRTLLREHGFTEDYRDSIVVIERDGADQRALVKSRAVLRILAGLGGFWRLFTVLRIIPQNASDWLYGQIAQRRHRLFRTASTCELGAVTPSRLFQNERGHPVKAG